ncbi:MAG: hypothetical protein ACE5F1_14740, partial [Planctomycetota bacterium]
MCLSPLLLILGLSGFAYSATPDGQAERAAARKRASGVVRRVDGTPWVGARVTLISRPFVPDPRLGVVDRIEAKTDARGRFRAEILLGRVYDAWALETLAGNRYRCSAIQTRIMAGVPIRLEEQKEDRIQVRVRLAALERWKDRAPLRLIARSSNAHCVFVPLTLDTRGEARLPPLPGRTARVEVRGKDGYLIMDSRVTLGLATRVKTFEKRMRAYKAWLTKEEKTKKNEKAREGDKKGDKDKQGEQEKTAKKAKKEKARRQRQVAVRTDLGGQMVIEYSGTGAEEGEKPLPPELHLIRLPERERLLLEVASKETGKPVAGATVHEFTGVELRFIARTDARGLAVLPVRMQRNAGAISVLQLLVQSGREAETYLMKYVRYPAVGQRSTRVNQALRDYYLDIEKGRDFAEVLANGTADIKLKLDSGISVKGRVMLDETTPASNLLLFFFGPVTQAPGRVSFSAGHAFAPRVFKTDAQGRFSIPGRAGGKSIRLGALLSQEQLAALPAELPRDIRASVLLALAETPEKQDLDLGELRVDELELLEVRVRAPDGTPADRPAVLVDPGAQGFRRSSASQFFDFQADRRGSLRVLMPKCDEVRIAACLEAQLKRLDTRVPAPQPVDITLDPAIHVSGTVINGRSKPVPGATVYFNSMNRGQQLLL